MRRGNEQFHGLQSPCQGRGSCLDPQISQPLCHMFRDDISPTSCRERNARNTYLSTYRRLLLSLHPSSLGATNTNKENVKDVNILRDQNITGFISFVERRPLPPPASSSTIGGPAACSRHRMAANIPRCSRIVLTRDGDKELANQPPKRNESPSTSRLGVHPSLKPANDGPIRVSRPAPPALAIIASRDSPVDGDLGGGEDEGDEKWLANQHQRPWISSG